MTTMKPEQFNRREARIAGWDVCVTSYKLGDTFYCKVDNVSPGAIVSRGRGPSLDEAEQQAIDSAMKALYATRRRAVD